MKYELIKKVLPLLLILTFAAKVFSQEKLKRDSTMLFTMKKIKAVRKTEIINAKPEEVFAFMDDINNTGMHMTKSNGAMMGSKLNLEWFTEQKTGLNTKYRWRGKVMWMNMDFTVKVTRWVQGKEKTWETIGDAQMIVLSWYRMYLILIPLKNGLTQAELGIYYTKPKESVLAFFFAKSYAKWCVNSMLKDTKKHFNTKNYENNN